MLSSKRRRVLATLLSMALAPTMASAFRATHVGDANPITEGFSASVIVAPGATTTAVTNDLGVNSWQMAATSTTTQFIYDSGAFTSAEKLGIATSGFTISFEARVLQGVASTIYSSTPYVIAQAGIDTGTRRFEVFLGLNANGDTVVVLPTSINNGGAGSRIAAPGASFTLTGQGNGYHNYDLSYSPITQQASLYVDGTLTATGYSGYNNFLGNDGLGFSVFSGGVARFAGVSLSISPVPEPTTGMLFVMGLAVVAFAGRLKNSIRV